MKKNFFFLLIFFVFGCSSDSNVISKSLCPIVLFSSEHKNYIHGDIENLSIDNLSYTAEINNYSINNDCKTYNQFIEGELSILFIVRPERPKKIDVMLPFYIAFLDSSDELIEMLEGENLKEEDANSIIMAARAHWFSDEDDKETSVESEVAPSAEEESLEEVK